MCFSSKEMCLNRATLYKSVLKIRFRRKLSTFSVKLLNKDLSRENQQ